MGSREALIEAAAGDDLAVQRYAHVEVARPFAAIFPVLRSRLWRDAIRRRMLALADALAVLTIGGVLALYRGDPELVGWFALFLPIWLVLAKLNELYDRDHRTLRHLTVDEVPQLFIWSAASTLAVSLLLLATPVHPLGIGSGFFVWVSIAVAALCLRALARATWRRWTPPERTVIIGGGPLAAATRRKLDLFPDIHVALVGQYSLEDPETASATWLEGVDRVIIASHSISEELIAELIPVCRTMQIKLSVVPPARGMLGTAVKLSRIADLLVVEYNTWDISRSTVLVKRLVDVVVSIALLVLLAPLFVIIALVVRLDSPGRPIFVQRRAGLSGRPFWMLKFRTMVSDAEERLSELVTFEALDHPMFKLPDDPRVTGVGRLLRRTSLDELPQLVNVLMGDMSLVGPRPEQLELVDLYQREHRFRLDVKPGITGPMQVFGRGELSFEERLALERDYIENLSFQRDLRILALTFTAVLSRNGAF